MWLSKKPRSGCSGVEYCIILQEKHQFRYR
nr:MAG TPA: hypothetical protein [Caudoviricetes sp.]